MVKNFYTFSCLVTALGIFTSNVAYAKHHESSNSFLSCDSSDKSQKSKHKKKRKFPESKELGIANDANKPSFPECITNEPSMAVNPANSKNIIVTANDNANPSGVNLEGVYTSFDGGNTWERQQIDWSSTGYSAQYDNSVAFGPKPSSKGFSYKHGARAYTCADVFLNNFASEAEAVAFAYSDDGGLNWNGLKIIGPADATVENDKPLITADLWPCSRNFGNVYATWTNQQFTDGEQSTFESETIMVTTSTDGGETFSAPVAISASDTSNQRRWGAFPVTAPDGTLYVFWWEVADIEQSNGFLQVINGNKSHDGGNTWLSEPFRVATLNFPAAVGFPYAVLPGTIFVGARPNPSAAADAENNIYVAFPNYDISTGHGWTSLARSSDGGCNWHERVVANIPGKSTIFPSVSANRFDKHSGVLVSFLAIDDVPVGTPVEGGAVFSNAYAVLSTDHGNSFSHPPTKISNASSDVAVSTGTYYVGIEFMGDYTWATDSPDGSFYYAWTDSRRGEPCAAVDAYRNREGPYPDVGNDCSSNFGRTDIVVARIKSTEMHTHPCYPLVGEFNPPTAP